jgi:hypothetical protein
MVVSGPNIESGTPKYEAECYLLDQDVREANDNTSASVILMSQDFRSVGSGGIVL